MSERDISVLIKLNKKGESLSKFFVCKKLESAFERERERENERDYNENELRENVFQRAYTTLT